MNDRNEFDEIARRKLEERRFAFEEAQWSIVERSLHASHGRSRRGILFFAIAALFIGTGVIWWTSRDTPGPVLAERASDKSEAAAQEHDKTTSAAVSNERTSKTASHEGTLDAPGTGKSANGDMRGPSEQNATVVGAQKPVPDAGPIASDQRERDAIPRDTKAAEATGVQSGASIVIDSETQHTDVAATESGALVTESEVQVNSGPEAALATGTMLPVSENMQLGTQGNGEAPGQVASPSSMAEADATATMPEKPSDPTHASHTAAQAGADTVGATPNLPLPSEVPDPLFGRWEVNLLAGGFSTLNHYSWDDDTDPGMEVQRASSAGYGAELMKMGAHFGWGSGLHYSSYAEQIAAAELSSTEQIQSTSYYLMPVDTTILVIIDTVMLGGTIHYVTGQLDTTFNVLASQTVTNTLTHQQREARKLVNLVSYLEIPLLFDAHVRSGHWNFGVRGGPTIGFLTSSRGSLPNAALDGYVDLQPEELRTAVFGYMARVYVHFALNDAWAIGVEPTAKGQLTSTLLEGDVVRKSSALGAFFSVTHRLR